MCSRRANPGTMSLGLLIWPNHFYQCVAFVHSTYRCGNYSREETIQGWKLFAEIRYVISLLDLRLLWQKQNIPLAVVIILCTKLYLVRKYFSYISKLFIDLKLYCFVIQVRIKDLDLGIFKSCILLKITQLKRGLIFSFEIYESNV